MCSHKVIFIVKIDLYDGKNHDNYIFEDDGKLPTQTYSTPQEGTVGMFSVNKPDYLLPETRLPYFPFYNLRSLIPRRERFHGSTTTLTQNRLDVSDLLNVNMLTRAGEMGFWG